MSDRMKNSDRAAHILVVDADKPMRQTIVAMLAPDNFECLQAGSSAEALAVLESGEPIDLMLVDLMEDMLGIALLERIQHEYPDMPVVISTAVYDIQVVLQALHIGAFDCLLKPFGLQQLLATARRALEHRRVKQEHRAHVSNLELQVAALKAQLRGRTQ